MRIFGFITGFFFLLASFGYLAPISMVLGATPALENKACENIIDSDEYKKCTDCMAVESPGVYTAIGCIKNIDADPGALLKKVIGLATGVAGGIAFLLILFGGLQIMTSAGNPEQLGAGRELVSSAITGLLMIIFSIFILQFIGVNIIGIPGFG